jgi:hypothetical protein
MTSKRRSTTSEVFNDRQAHVLLVILICRPNFNVRRVLVPLIVWRSFELRLLGVIFNVKVKVRLSTLYVVEKSFQE